MYLKIITLALIFNYSTWAFALGNIKKPVDTEAQVEVECPKCDLEKRKLFGVKDILREVDHKNFLSKSSAYIIGDENEENVYIENWHIKTENRESESSLEMSQVSGQ